MNTPLSRRDFLRRSAVASASVAALTSFPSILRAAGANDRLVVGVMGLGRGMAHIEGFLSVPNVEIGYVCDVDERRIAEGIKAVEKRQTSRAVRGVRDFRRILEDRSVDILSIAAPNFWHAPASILACSAGKHVYVEKPGSHNAREAELIVAAARKHKRKVQMGNQRRSTPAVIEAIDKLRSGAIGKLRYARCWYDATRGTIGRGKNTPIPAWLDWGLWQGPAPERPYKDNLVHYNWHWLWHYGGGELANNGVHAIDIARWGLGVDYPARVTCNGARYHFIDDQETPDTTLVTYDYGKVGIHWDSSSCLPRKNEAHPFVAFYGDAGTLALGGGATYQIFDLNGKEIYSAKDRFSDVPHFTNLADAIRNGAVLNSDIADAQKSSLISHLGNIAWRTGRTLDINQETGRILHDQKAMRLWKREYRRGWEPKV